jgi:hypothetical protein
MSKGQIFFSFTIVITMAILSLLKAGKISSNIVGHFFIAISGLAIVYILSILKRKK